MKLGQGELPPFIGYLPPVVDGVLLELVNMSYRDYPPRRGRTGAQLSQERKMAIDSLRLQFRAKPHYRALEIMARAMEQQKPFCLYLRNFGLGARVYAAGNNPFGIPQVATLMSNMFDADMQRRIESVVSPTVPALCIGNPADAVGILPAFLVEDEEWEPLARTLVRNAGLIILYFLTATTGVAEELALIRSEGKQDASLVVAEENNPYEDEMGMEAMFDVKRNEPPIVQTPMDDFTHQVRRSGEGWEVVDAKLTEMLRRNIPPPVDKRIELPLALEPPEELQKFCTDVATKEFDAAMKLVEEKEYEEAEDVLTRSIAYAHWGRDTLGRVVTLMTLARLNLVGFKAKGDAGDYYEMALDVCEEIRSTSPMAAELYPLIQKELNDLRAEAEAKRTQKPD
jgi:hypothetical protein